MTTKAQRTEWRKLQGQGMTSAVGEYTPPEFWELLDDVDRLAEALQTALEAGQFHGELKVWAAKWLESLKGQV
jgi:hypothetical protein